ncbi:polygalacturonase QRT3-like [Vigna radiata var. radiata]|uniref:Polygalacturonase QRT3-like n=1 Tax=Vigna radiata var. radiata TaxID=3916 RepID=A0A3Q0EZX9_VIGRR|nr:polygalacturonase QRT3-like [Vigna radiata var. radiata]
MRCSMLVYLFLVAQEVTCFDKHAPPLSHFRIKFKDRMALAVAVSSQPPSASPSTKMSGRVVYPAEYGADPTGEDESSDAIVKAVEDAFGIESEVELVAGIRDLGGV